jgi:hypothetical protein
MTKLQAECLTVADSVLLKEGGKAKKMEVKSISQYLNCVSIALLDEDDSVLVVPESEICSDRFLLVE